MHGAVLAHAPEARQPRTFVAWSGARARSLTLMLGEEERRRRFGYALQEALRARKLSERQLAMRLQVDPRKVAAWRSGRTLPNIYETLALAVELQVSEALFRDPPPVPEPPRYPIWDYLLDAADEGAVRGLQATDQDAEDDDEPDVPPRLRRR